LVFCLPPDAVCLAFNSHEPNQAFRIGKCAWGVQFHPEYTSMIMRSYIEEQRDELREAGAHIADLQSAVEETLFRPKL